MTRSSAAEILDYGNKQCLDGRTEDIILQVVRRATPAERAIDKLSENPRITVGEATIEFTSPKWDLTALTDAPVSRETLRISFRRHRFDGFVRLWVLYALATEHDKAQSILNNAKKVDRFAEFVDSLDLASLSLLDEGVVEAYVGWRKKSISDETLWQDVKTVIEFLKFYELSVAPIACRKVYESLLGNKVSQWSRPMSKPPVPAKYMGALKATCMRVMRDGAEGLDDRILACSLLIISQTGMRPCELAGLRADAMRVSEAPVEGEPDIPYIVFMSPKGVSGDNEWIEAHCALNDVAYEAFMTALELGRGHREKKGFDTLIVFKFQRMPFISQSAFRDRASLFIAERRAEIPCINSQAIFPELSSTSVLTAYKTRRKNGSTAEYLKANCPDLCESDVFVYPKLGQFRSTVVTELRRRGVDWKYIQTQVTHLDDDSADSYCYDRRETDAAHSESLYRMIFLGKATMLGNHAGGFMAKVESYIEETGLNVAESLDEVVEAAAGKFPLREKLGGVCIRCGNFTSCEEDGVTDELLCAFDACPNHCHFFFNASHSYSLAEERAEIIKLNESKRWTKAAMNEKRKLKNIVENRLMPELLELEKEIGARGVDDVLECHPHLKGIALNLSEALRKAKSWTEM